MNLEYIRQTTHTTTAQPTLPSYEQVIKKEQHESGMHNNAGSNRQVKICSTSESKMPDEQSMATASDSKQEIMRLATALTKLGKKDEAANTWGALINRSDATKSDISFAINKLLELRKIDKAADLLVALIARADARQDDINFAIDKLVKVYEIASRIG